ncbi:MULTISPECIES: hypothetical protein [Oceanobacillus]|uniref:hypothetical protein n=1 Tax=Oceanobacillus TaxID=182709 RepID=UPI000596260E|nr:MULTISPECIES: hypothetical protein [Oceanobacillus]
MNLRLEIVESILNEYEAKESEIEKADLAVQFIDNHGLFLLEQAKRANKNAQELYDMDLQLVSEQRLIKQLENHIKRHQAAANIIKHRMSELRDERDKAKEDYLRLLKAAEE